MEEIVRALIGGDEISDDDREAYMEVIAESMLIHLDRERIRKGLWKEYPAKDQVYHIRVKADRVMRTLEQGFEMTEDQKQNAMEELIDIINYSIFAHRILNNRI